ncbi:MAG: preprotein translocase subunit SecA [Candidatus Xenobiia bacterium LiM19]
MSIDGIKSQPLTGLMPLSGAAADPSRKVRSEGDASSPAMPGDSVTITQQRTSRSSRSPVKDENETLTESPAEKPDMEKRQATQSSQRASNPSCIATLEEPPSQEGPSMLSRMGSSISGMVNHVKNYITGAPDVEEFREVAKQVEALTPQMAALSDGELKAKTTEFRNRIQKGLAAGKQQEAVLGEILPEAFAAMREADRRVLAMEPFEEQLMAGVAAHRGTIVEQKTGEGKTLMETLPVYLNALAGNGVHVVTVNPYLAKRDSEWMGKALNFMGVSVGVITQDMTTEDRKKANTADVTYGTNDEFGFQYLRDNLSHERESQAGRDLSKVFALVDEVDSILIDEARTPLIISRQSGEEPPPFGLFSELAHHLKEGIDYKVDRKDHAVNLTERGTAMAEKMLGVENLYAEENSHMVPYVMNAVTAKTLYSADVDYVKRDGQIMIVDEFTGRLMPGRRYSEGLHEAIEAKEGVQVKPRTETLGMITFQNYFKLYGKLAGMTGTGITARDEFREVFGKDVALIPTHKPVIRHDLPDMLYKTEREKFQAVAEKISELHDKGQPVLIGTRSIEKSELLSELLTSLGIQHQVLNAKNHFEEAEIIAQAGRPGMVTVATNMAGRGVDIKLGGDAEKLAAYESSRNNSSYQETLAKYSVQCGADKGRVKSLGGLAVIGTERHEDRRIDDQLRGRSGRQGDPGSSQFFISLDDEMIRLFGGEKTKRLVEKMGLADGEPIQSRLISKAIEVAQQKCERRNLDIRKNLMRYDWVINKQRETVFSDRDAVLDGENLKPVVLDMIYRAVDTIIERHCDGGSRLNADMISEIDRDMAAILSAPAGPVGSKTFKKTEELKDYLTSVTKNAYEKKEKRVGSDNLRFLERDIFLSVLDESWIGEQTNLKDLREGIWLRAYGQQDPDVEYFKEAHESFENMKDNAAIETVRTLFSLPDLVSSQSAR